MIDHLLSRADLVVITTKYENFTSSSGRLLQKYLQQKACRACSTIFFPRSTNHIIDLWRRGCFAVVISQTPFVAGQLAPIRALIMLLFVFCAQASDFILLLPFRLPKNQIFLQPNFPFKQNFLFLQTSKKFPCMHNRGQPALGPVSRNFSDDINLQQEHVSSFPTWQSFCLFLYLKHIKSATFYRKRIIVSRTAFDGPDRDKLRVFRKTAP